MQLTKKCTIEVFFSKIIVIRSLFSGDHLASTSVLRMVKLRIDWVVGLKNSWLSSIKSSVTAGDFYELRLVIMAQALNKIDANK